MRLSKRIILVTVILLGCVGCDQATKKVAQAYLTDARVWTFLGDSFRLQLAYNHGAFLSLGAGLPENWRIGLFSLVAGSMLLGLLAYILIVKSVTEWELWAYCLVLAGGAGNLIDRVLYGYVVDFMNMGIGSLRTGIFNVADIAVSLGAAILLVHSFQTKKPD